MNRWVKALLMFAGITAARFIIGGMDFPVPEEWEYLFFLLFNMVMTILTLGLPGVLLYRCRWRFSLSEMANGIPLMLVARFVGAVVTMGWLTIIGLQADAVSAADFQTAPLELLIVCVIAPICEELFFRGYLQQSLGLWPTAFLFAISHYSLGALPFYLVIAFMLGIYREKTDNLHACMLMHAYFNLSSFFPMQCVGAGLAMVPVCMIIRRYYAHHSSGSV